MVACSIIPTAQEGEDFYKLEASVVFIVSSRAAQGNPIKEEEEEGGGGRGRETETGERERKTLNSKIAYVKPAFSIITMINPRQSLYNS